MLTAASWVLIAIYLLLPPASLSVAWRGRPWVRRTITGGWISGVALGTAVLAAFAIGIGGRVSPGEALRTIYLGVGLLLLLKAIDAAITAGLRRLVRIERQPTRGRRLGVAVGRLGLFGGFALPWVMAAAMIYRPHVVVDDSLVDLQMAAERVDFPAADGTPIAGRFYPADADSHTTALVCHGLGGNRAGFARMIRALHEAGIGVLAINLRAHGESGGHRCTFGLTERDDVLGAVAWLKQERAEASTRVVGVGASLGAAALLSAAADAPDINGVVVLSTYTSLSDEADAVSKRQLAGPIGWLVRYLGVPMASLHAGVDLRHERPIDDVAALWPRPVLIVHGTDDEIIPFEQGRRLYDVAPIGRQSMWVQHGTHNGILDDDAVIARVVAFIRSAKPTPVV